MSKLRVTLLVAVVPLLILLTDRSTRGEMSGDRGRPIVMLGTVAGDDGRDRCRFSIEIERVSSTRSSGAAVTVMTASRALASPASAESSRLHAATVIRATTEPSETATRSRARDAWEDM